MRNAIFWSHDHIDRRANLKINVLHDLFGVFWGLSLGKYVLYTYYILWDAYTCKLLTMYLRKSKVRCVYEVNLIEGGTELGTFD